MAKAKPPSGARRSRTSAATAGSGRKESTRKKRPAAPDEDEDESPAPPTNPPKKSKKCDEKNGKKSDGGSIAIKPARPARVSNGGSLAIQPARVSMSPREQQLLICHFEAMKETLRMRDAKIKKYEEEKAEAARKKTNDKIRWGKRYIMTTYPAAQQVVNNFARLYWEDGNVFLCAGFHRHSEDSDSIYGMIWAMLDDAGFKTPAGMVEYEFWKEHLCGALAYKVQTGINQRLQKMRVKFIGLLC